MAWFSKSCVGEIIGFTCLYICMAEESAKSLLFGAIRQVPAVHILCKNT